MTGTWVNVAGIVMGSLIGLLLKKGIPDRINDAILKAEGLAILMIGLNGMLAAMFSVTQEGRLSENGGLLLLVSLVLGCLAGELIDIDEKLERFGRFVEGKAKTTGFARGFIASSLIFSIGAMTIIGSLNDGLRGDSGVLFVKSALDFTTAIIMASALGFGVFFSIVPVFLIQGSISLLARGLEPVLQGALLDQLCMVGYAIVLCIGLNFLLAAKLKIANFLPALLVPVLYHAITTGIAR